MRLVDIPITELQTTKNWIIGLTGQCGTITAFSSILSGIQVQLVIHVEWEDGRKAEYHYPDDVVNLKVKEKKISNKLGGYMTFRKENMLKQLEYFDKFTFVPEPEVR